MLRLAMQNDPLLVQAEASEMHLELAIHCELPQFTSFKCRIMSYNNDQPMQASWLLNKASVPIKLMGYIGAEPCALV